MVSTTATGGSTGGSNDVATALGGMSKSLGAIQMTGDMISTTLTLFKDAFKPVMVVVSAILKLVNLLVMPFTNLLIPLLLPIIYILAPMAKFLNMVMRPVYQMLMLRMKNKVPGILEGYKKMGTGALTGNMGMMGAGLEEVFNLVKGEVMAGIKIFSGLIMDVLGNPLSLGKNWVKEGFADLSKAMTEGNNGVRQSYGDGEIIGKAGIAIQAEQNASTQRELEAREAARIAMENAMNEYNNAIANAKRQLESINSGKTTGWAIDSVGDSVGLGKASERLGVVSKATFDTLFAGKTPGSNSLDAEFQRLFGNVRTVSIQAGSVTVNGGTSASGAGRLIQNGHIVRPTYDIFGSPPPNAGGGGANITASSP